MNILIDNVGFVNKGAELMLCSIVEKLKQRYPDAQLLISYNSFIQGGFEYCCENNILPLKTGFISKLESIFYNLCIKKGLMSKKSIRYFIHSSNVGIIIDAAGFQYGDQWKHTTKTIKRVKKYYNSFKKGCKLVLLPQSFGPFERKESIETVNAVLKNTGLVYAREDISLNYLKNIACNKDNIIFKRDFTILTKKIHLLMIY